MSKIALVGLSLFLIIGLSQTTLASSPEPDHQGRAPASRTLWVQAEGAAACLIGNHSGVSDSDVQTAASLVCDELRSHGIQVGQPVLALLNEQSLYRINLSLMGNTYIFDVTFESPPSQIQERRRVRLTSLDEVLDQAPRIADSLFSGAPLAEEGPAVVVEVAPPAETTTQPQYTGGIACLIGDHGGLPDSDAQTAAALACDELRRLGVAVGQPVTEAPGATQAYRVNTQRLGRIVMYELVYESPVGTPVDNRRLQLANIEEIPVAAPRLAQALVQGVPIEQTADVESLVGQETRQPGEMPGDTYWGIGIVGLGMVGTDIFGAPGVVFRFFYEATRYAVGSDILFAGGSPSGDDNGIFFSWGVGGRYFFNRGNIGIFAGGGFAWDTLATYRGGDEEYEDQWEGVDTGVGFYGEGGVEFFRMYGSRLLVMLRVDVPFFSLEEERYLSESDITLKDSNYVLPISLSVTYAW
ncbi:MAG: hypothetical protein JW797_03995 [Bradymonadales bacterium]|nr:hypothetical protein [Bradymonadales bacterium]